ncbi:MAG: hypothetical protein HC782_00135 [Gammaproteobacteria bacterium]|nr:hypothetical protein [Gammaproteobacteria bacterium]
MLVLHYDDEVGRQNYQTVAKELVKFGQTPTALALKRNTDATKENVKALIDANPKIILATTGHSLALRRSIHSTIGHCLILKENR